MPVFVAKKTKKEVSEVKTDEVAKEKVSNTTVSGDSAKENVSSCDKSLLVVISKTVNRGEERVVHVEETVDVLRLVIMAV